MIFPGFSSQNSRWDAVVSPGSYFISLHPFLAFGITFCSFLPVLFHGQCLSDTRFPWSTLSTAFMGGCLLPLSTALKLLEVDRLISSWLTNTLDKFDSDHLGHCQGHVSEPPFPHL